MVQTLPASVALQLLRLIFQTCLLQLLCVGLRIILLLSGQVSLLQAHGDLTGNRKLPVERPQCTLAELQTDSEVDLSMLPSSIVGSEVDGTGERRVVSNKHGGFHCFRLVLQSQTGRSCNTPFLGFECNRPKQRIRECIRCVLFEIRLPTAKV